MLLPQYKEHFDKLIAAFTRMLSEAKATRFISQNAKVQTCASSCLVLTACQKEIADVFNRFVNFNSKVLSYQQLRYVVSRTRPLVLLLCPLASLRSVTTIASLRA